MKRGARERAREAQKGRSMEEVYREQERENAEDEIELRERKRERKAK